MNKETRKERKELRRLEGNTVSYQVKDAFFIDFGDLPLATWERTTYFDEAMFSKDGTMMTAYYDNDAKLVGTTVHKKFSDLPAKAQSYIDSKYSGYNKTDVILFDDNEANESDMILYGSQFEDADNYFVPLTKDNHTVILQVNMHGDVSFFKKI